MSLFKQTALGERTINKINQRAIKINKSYSNSVSPGPFTSEYEENRIETLYIKPKYLRRILTKGDAIEAVKSLILDPVSRSKIFRRDMENLLRGAKLSGRNKFTDFIYRKEIVVKINKIQSSNIKLNSGKEIRGLKISPRSYLVIQNGKIQAKSFKTGRFVSIPRKNKIVESLWKRK